MKTKDAKSRLLRSENDEKARKSWLVIIIGDDERHGPFEITRGALIRSIIGLIVVFAVITVGISWRYSRSYVTTNYRLAEELATVRQTIGLISRGKESSLAEIKGLKAEIETAREKRKTLASAEKKEEKAVAAAETNPFVSLEEVQIIYDAGDEKLKVRSIIKKQSLDEDRISGYLFITLNPEPGTSAFHKSSPVAELIGGVPRSYKQGEHFSIARFKHIEGVFPSISDRSKYTAVSFLVYTDDGTLRMKKDVPVNLIKTSAYTVHEARAFPVRISMGNVMKDDEKKRE